jgi:hypothetical protein
LHRQPGFSGKALGRSGVFLGTSFGGKEIEEGISRFFKNGDEEGSFSSHLNL